jgi:hypothetical protein
LTFQIEVVDNQEFNAGPFWGVSSRQIGLFQRQRSSVAVGARLIDRVQSVLGDLHQFLLDFAVVTRHEAVRHDATTFVSFILNDGVQFTIPSFNNAD